MSKKNKKQKLFKRSKFKYYRKSIIWVSFLIIILYGTSFWSNHQSLEVKDVEVVGNRFAEENQILNIFNEEIKGKYLFLIPKDNHFFIPEKVIIEKIKKIYSVDNVLINKSEVGKVSIEIIEHQPIAYYCLEKCYFLNNRGLLFVEAPEVYFDDVIEIEGETNFEGEIIGQYFTDSDVFENMIEKINLLDNEEIDINKMSTEDFETFTLYTVGGPTLLVERQDTPQVVIENLKSALAQESIHEVQFNNIDYIDLRFEDKVFYKLK
jgi:cell division septal protein FtsQ